MRRHSHFFAAAAAVGALVAPIAARAECFTQEPVPHVIDTAMREVDQKPPTFSSSPTYLNYVGRGHESPGAEGCGGSGDPGCDAYGVVHIEINLASDDQTPSVKIGYRFTVASGTPPAGLVFPENPVELPPGETAFIFLWNDGATDRQEPVDFTLSIAAVDQAGNESTPQTVVVRDASPGLPNTTPYNDGNCRISNSRMPPRGVVFMASLLVMAIVRRRRVRS